MSIKGIASEIGERWTIRSAPAKFFYWLARKIDRHQGFRRERIWGIGSGGPEDKPVGFTTVEQQTQALLARKGTILVKRVDGEPIDGSEVAFPRRKLRVQ